MDVLFDGTDGIIVGSDSSDEGAGGMLNTDSTEEGSGEWN